MDNIKGCCKYFLLLTLVLSSCGINSKKSYLDSFEDFVVDIESCETITSEQITSIKKDYLDYSETYYNQYEPELTDADKRRISKLKVRYYKVLARYEMQEVEGVINDLKDKANEFVNNILE